MVWKCWRAPSIYAFNGYTFVLCWLSSPKWFPVAFSLKSRKCFPFSPHLSQLLTLHLMHILESNSSTSPIPSGFEVNICGEVLTCNNLWIVVAQESCFFHLMVTQNPTTSHRVFISSPTDRSLCSYALCFASVKTDYTLCCIFPCLKRLCYICLSLYRLYDPTSDAEAYCDLIKVNCLFMTVCNVDNSLHLYGLNPHWLLKPQQPAFIGEPHDGSPMKCPVFAKWVDCVRTNSMMQSVCVLCLFVCFYLTHAANVKEGKG